MQTAFEFSNVSFSYAAGAPVLRSFSLTIDAGTFVAVVGPNGAGKSTLLKLCAGLLKPQAGTIHMLGIPSKQFSNWAKIGYIPQNCFHNRSFPITVQELVAMGRAARLGIGGRLKDPDKQIIAETLQAVGLTEYRKHMIGELSGGQLQRAVIARTLAAKPEVLLLDEATSGIDTGTKQELYSLLRTMNRDMGISIIMVSHDVEQVLPFVDKVANISQGLRYYGDTAGFLQQYHSSVLCNSFAYSHGGASHA